MKSFELRQYTMKPGCRDGFAALFDRVFVEPQEAVGSRIIGQFRDLDRPERFVWIRGHADYDARKDALHAFYDGPHWAEHKFAANDAIGDSDNVLLFQPAWEGSGFADEGVRAPDGSTAPQKGIIAASLLYFDAPVPPEFVAAFRERLSALGNVVAVLVNQTLPNNFPRHPARAGENVFAWFTVFANTDATLPALPADMARRWQCREERIRLSPTARSRLHA